MRVNPMAGVSVFALALLALSGCASLVSSATAKMADNITLGYSRTRTMRQRCVTVRRPTC